MTTTTDKDLEELPGLVERLRQRKSARDLDVDPLCIEAADTLESLAAEVVRLREALEEIKAIKPRKIANSSFVTGPVLHFQQAQRIARKALGGSPRPYSPETLAERADIITPPLDAYETAKPDEPTFTLQGGDPLAARLVQFWAQLARLRAGVIPRSELAEAYATNCVADAIENSVADDEREVRNLAVRATAAEEVSWAMQEYQKSQHGTDKPTEAADTHLDELARIDLHDLKVRVAQGLSNIRGSAAEMVTALRAKGFNDEDTLDNLEILSDLARDLNQIIEPRRIMKRDN